MSNVSRKIELIANVAIILVAMMLGMVLVKTHLIPAPAPQTEFPESANQPSQPSKIGLSGMEWSKHRATLVLAISSTCHFCTESAPFYRQIASEPEGTYLVAVLPQPVEDGKRYLNGLGVHVDEVLQAPLNSINVRGTPTLLLVNSNGDVTGTWVGRLPVDQEAEVLAQLKRAATTEN